MKKYLILGKGWIGSRIHKCLRADISESKIYGLKDVVNAIEKYEPEVIINAIGKTGFPNVDWCETHKQETLFGNVTVPLLLAEACETEGIQLVHIGTGCIYDNFSSNKQVYYVDRYFSEKDTPNFFGSYYSRTKYYVEQLLKEFKVLQLRIRMPFDVYEHQKNLFSKLTKYDKLIELSNSMTYIPMFIEALDHLIHADATGIYNIVCNGGITHPELMDLYEKIMNKEVHYDVITIKELHEVTQAKRSNCLLSPTKLEKSGFKVLDIYDAVQDGLKKYKSNVESQ